MKRERGGKEGGGERVGGNKSERTRTRKKGEGKEDREEEGHKEVLPKVGETNKMRRKGQWKKHGAGGRRGSQGQF